VKLKQVDEELWEDAMSYEWDELDDCHCTETLEALDITIAERDECYERIAKLEKALKALLEDSLKVLLDERVDSYSKAIKLLKED
jgi:hypothetical protein